jgi:hypothetical protein
VAGVLEQLDRKASNLVEDSFPIIMMLAISLPPKGCWLDETRFVKVLEMCEKEAVRNRHRAGRCVTSPRGEEQKTDYQHLG